VRKAPKARHPQVHEPLNARGSGINLSMKKSIKKADVNNCVVCDCTLLKALLEQANVINASLSMANDLLRAVIAAKENNEASNPSWHASKAARPLEELARELRIIWTEGIDPRWGEADPIWVDVARRARELGAR
jgi:hypothetical protein